MWWRQGVGVVMLTAVAVSQALVAQKDPGTRYRAGYEELRITDPARTRPIQLDVWYPAQADEVTHRYGLSTGRVAPGAPMATGQAGVPRAPSGAPVTGSLGYHLPPNRSTLRSPMPRLALTVGPLFAGAMCVEARWLVHRDPRIPRAADDTSSRS